MTESYEKALAKYQKRLHTTLAPLICWDFFDAPTLEINVFNTIQKHWHEKVNFHEMVHLQHQEIVITNSNFEIVFATQGIFKMTGYHPEEVLGKSPKMFQGNLTSEATKKNIREAMLQKHPFHVKIVNYKKDGTTYLCEVTAYPKYNPKGEFINYIAFERDAS